MMDESIDDLAVERRDTTSELGRHRKMNAALFESFKTCSIAIKEIRYKGAEITEDDYVGVSQMIDDLITGLKGILSSRIVYLERHIATIDRIAKRELPPERLWEWPSDHDTSLEH